MWCSTLGTENRPSCNTFKSTNVSTVMSGDLLKYQEGGKSFIATPAQPLIFSSPPSFKETYHKRNKSIVPTSSSRPQGMNQKNVNEQLSQNGNSKKQNLFQTTYHTLTQHSKAPRPSSAAPNKSAVQFKDQKTCSLYERPYDKLFKEYQRQKATENFAKSLKNNQPKAVHQNGNNEQKILVDKVEKPSEQKVEKPVENSPVKNSQKPSQPNSKKTKAQRAKSHAPGTGSKAAPNKKKSELAPQDMSNLYEIGLRHHKMTQEYENKKLRARLDFEAGKNNYEQNKLKEKIQTLKDQQIEKNFCNLSKKLEEKQRFRNTIMKRDFAESAKNDLTAFLKRKDDNFRAYSMDKTNLNQTMNERKQLMDDQITLSAYVQHNDRKNRFLARNNL